MFAKKVLICLVLLGVLLSMPVGVQGEGGRVLISLQSSMFYQINRWKGPNPSLEIDRFLRVHTSEAQWFWVSFHLPNEYRVGWEVETAVLGLHIFSVGHPVELVVKNDDAKIVGRGIVGRNAKIFSLDVARSLREGEGEFMLYVYAQPVNNVSAGASFYSPFVEPGSLRPTLSVVLREYVWEPCYIVQRIDPETDAACKESARLAGDSSWESWRGIYFCECRGEGTDCSRKNDGFMCIKGELLNRPGPNDCDCR